MKTYTAGPCDTCGHVSGPSKSQALAEHGMRRHSCEREQARRDRAARVQARKTASGPVRDCTCPQARHEHGERNAYVVDKCRCRACRDAAADYERHRTRQRAYGREPYVLAGAARLHVLTLGRQGMGWKRVAAAAGIESSVVWKLVYGDRSRGLAPSKRIRPETEAKILAVALDLADGALIDGTGTRRRLRALCAVGWSQTRLAACLGMETGNLGVLIHGKRGGQVTVAKARAVAALYDELWDQTPEADGKWEAGGITKAKRTAALHGWAPPLAWDDDTIDDPNAAPAQARTESRRGRSSEALIEDVEWYLSDVDAMATAEQVAHRLGYSDRSSVQNGLIRAGRRDLLDRLDRNARLATGQDARRAAS